MADHHVQSGSDDASPEEFYDLAKSAGTRMNTALQEVRNRADDTEAYITFEIKDYEEILRKTVEKFETEVSHRCWRRHEGTKC